MHTHEAADINRLSSADLAAGLEHRFADLVDRALLRVGEEVLEEPPRRDAWTPTVQSSTSALGCGRADGRLT